MVLMTYGILISTKYNEKLKMLAIATVYNHSTMISIEYYTVASQLHALTESYVRGSTVEQGIIESHNYVAKEHSCYLCTTVVNDC